MMFLKKWWWLLVAGAVAALLLWRLWPKTPGVKRKITFFDLPIITGGGSTIAPDERDRVVDAPDAELDDLIKNAIAGYDNG